MLNYIIAVSKDKYPIVLDYETNEENCEPDTGFIEEFECWYSDKEEYTDKYGEGFNSEVLSESGIYKIEGYDSGVDTQDGYHEGYTVTNIIKLSDLPY